MTAGGFHLNSAPKLSNLWGPPLSAYCHRRTCHCLLVDCFSIGEEISENNRQRPTLIRPPVVKRQTSPDQKQERNNSISFFCEIADKLRLGFQNGIRSKICTKHLSRLDSRAARNHASLPCRRRQRRGQSPLFSTAWKQFRTLMPSYSKGLVQAGASSSCHQDRVRGRTLNNLCMSIRDRVS